MEPADFQDVTKVTFKKYRHGSGAWKNWFSVSDPDNVRGLVSGIQLKPFGSNPRPACRHELVASFQKTGGGFDVDFCMACFGGHYMPERFYAKFQRLARRHRSRVAMLCSALVVAAVAMILLATRAMK